MYCGHMKKLSWMLQRQYAAHERQSQRNENCVMCNKKPTSGSMRGIGKSTCKLCYGCVCYSCKIRRRISFIALDGKLTQRKITFVPSVWARLQCPARRKQLGTKLQVSRLTRPSQHPPSLIQQIYRVMKRFKCFVVQSQQGLHHKCYKSVTRRRLFGTVRVWRKCKYKTTMEAGQ